MAAERPGTAPGKASFWRSFPIFEDLGPQTLARIAAAASPQRWAAGALLFQRGDGGDYLVALDSGRVRLAITTPQGRELTLRHAGPGDLLGEMALFDAQPRSADAVAAVATAGHVLHRAAFRQIADLDPALMQGAARWLCRRLRETTDQLEGIVLYNLEPRLARFLLFTLHQIHGESLPPHPALRLDLSQSDLAAVLGASRPKVNGALHGLRHAGAIRPDGGVILCDVAALRLIAEPAD
ncbi:cyclic nucleotide-binding domain-containing protein [Paracoccus sp. YIM 132242]|uniref:Cyclic nucleotide-binding domain-containing protein n=1 Tax=Paracoccus lichenicola TaxID=2665644 RepID=A0A6L6HPK5_9RHOB|nr:Crp/Fnr family transcriptional regulator [Paracoccus lichenicola]MTE01094.1 cyclic nucleotide-binding domain-containing protein [Paracoccus lichenicola]